MGKPTPLLAIFAGFLLAACSAPAFGPQSHLIQPLRSRSYSDGFNFAPIFANDDALSETTLVCSPSPAARYGLPPSPTTNFDRNWEEGCKAGAVGVNRTLDASAFEDGYKEGSVLGATAGLGCPTSVATLANPPPPTGRTPTEQLAWLAGCHVLTYFRDSTIQPPELAESQAAQGYQYGMSHKRSITTAWCMFEESGIQPPANASQWEQGCSDYIRSDNTFP